MDSSETNVDRLLKARAAIEDQLRQAKTDLTVLFTDLVGSTSYFDRYGDTAGLAMLQRHADVAGNIFTRFDGRVIKTIGDSVMAVFPEPGAAVRAAVELQREQARRNQGLPKREQHQLRIGINSGLGFRHGNDVYGDVVNVAARITKHTGPAQVLVSRTVQEAIPAGADFSCRPLAQIAFAGKAEKEDIFEVLWADTAAYTALQKELTVAVAQGELVCPGLRPEDLLSPGHISAPVSTREPVTQPTLPTSVPADLSLPAAVTARYEIRRQVGRGGMGVVYEALDRETGEVVALKMIRPEIAADNVAMERFKNELRLARRITHKNVCRVHEFHRAEGFAYISMEFVEGESFRTVLNRLGSLSLRRGLEVAAQICAGLSEAHSQGVVHRDLKPENVMEDRAGRVKVMDFGIARSLDASTLGTGGLVGTLLYMAPEQAEGKTVDHRADIYSLGHILYEMFTGTPAFRGENPAAVLLQQIRETPRSPRHVQPTLPAHLNDAILRCLEKDPDRRFPSVDALLEALAHPEAAPAAQERPRVEVPLEATHPALFPAAGESAHPSVAVPPPPLPRATPPAMISATVPTLRPRARRTAWLVGVGAGVVIGLLAILRFFPLVSPKPGPATNLPSPAQLSGAPPTEPSPTAEPGPAQGMTGVPSPAREETKPEAQQEKIRAELSRAQQALEEGRYGVAIAAFSNVLQMDRANEEARAGLREARQAITESAPLVAARQQVRLRLREAEQSLERRNYGAAIQAFQSVLDRDPGNARAQNGLIRARQAQNLEVLQRPLRSPRQDR